LPLKSASFTLAPFMSLTVKSKFALPSALHAGVALVPSLATAGPSSTITGCVGPIRPEIVRTPAPTAAAAAMSHFVALARVAAGAASGAGAAASAAGG
jgi:hypothetical protein